MLGCGNLDFVLNLVLYEVVHEHPAVLTPVVSVALEREGEIPTHAVPR